MDNRLYILQSECQIGTVRLFIQKISQQLGRKQGREQKLILFNWSIAKFVSAALPFSAVSIICSGVLVFPHGIFGKSLP